MLGHGAHRLDVPVDIGGDALAVSTSPALQSDTVVVVADAPETRLALCALRTETLVLGVFQTHRCFWGGDPERVLRFRAPRFAGRFVTVRVAPGFP